MKRYILLLVLIAVALPLVNAVPDNIVAGPYKILFDLGSLSNDYETNITLPEAVETLNGDNRTDYSAVIRSTSDSMHYATITIKYFEEEMPIATGSEFESALKEDDPRITGFKSDTRTIDGASGAVASMNYKYDSDIFYTIYHALFDPKDTIDLYHAIYQASFDPTQTIVEIFSTYPWNEGTLQLLKTIHVEKVN